MSWRREKAEIRSCRPIRGIYIYIYMYVYPSEGYMMMMMMMMMMMQRSVDAAFLIYWIDLYRNIIP